LARRRDASQVELLSSTVLSSLIVKAKLIDVRRRCSRRCRRKQRVLCSDMSTDRSRLHRLRTDYHSTGGVL
jgi:hypothetical protein